jgi:hypothetical protein
MKMPSEILTWLLEGEHFNVEERKALGPWPLETLNYHDLLEHLSKVIENREWFPREFEEHRSGSAVHEGICVQRKASDRFVCFAQRARADAPRVLAQKSETTFRTPREAAEFYLKWELHLPGNLDGWAVV